MWKHECERVFNDKLTNYKDKDVCSARSRSTITEVFDEAVVSGIPEQELLMVNFLRDDIYDEDGVMQEEAPKVYEPGGTLKEIKSEGRHVFGQVQRGKPVQKDGFSTF